MHAQTTIDSTLWGWLRSYVIRSERFDDTSFRCVGILGAFLYMNVVSWITSVQEPVDQRLGKLLVSTAAV